MAITAGIGSDHVDLQAAMDNKVDVVDPVTNGSLPICTLSTGSVAHPTK